MTKTQMNWLHYVAGPAIFLIVLTLPIFGPPNARFGFGLLFWMVYWWVTPAVDIKVTCLVPVLVAAAYPFLPVEKVLQAYMDKELLLIIGMSMMTAAWARWGFAKRIGLRFLSPEYANELLKPGALRIAFFGACALVVFGFLIMRNMAGSDD